MTQDSAMKAVAEYCNDLELLAAGADFKDLGISDRRKAMLPEVIKVENGAIVDRYELSYDGGAIPAGSYARLKLSGTMRLEDGMSSRGINSMAQDIQRANANPNISAILIEATTGGGESLSGQALKNAIKDSQKPVLVYAHYLGSAGVHGAIAADYIMAAGSTSSIGSIGTFVSINKKIVEWYNDNVDDIYSDASPEKNKEWREYLNGNKEPFVQLVKQDAINFQNEVRKYRNLTGDVEHTLSGAMLPADLALERGLIDSIGTFQDAINMLGQLVESQQQQRNNQHFQQTNEQMFDKLISKLNEQFGWSLGQDASVEDVVSNVQTIEDRRAELEATVTEQNEKIEAVTAKATSTSESIEAMNAKMEAALEAVSAKNEKLATKLEELTAQNAQRTEEAEKVAKALANATQNRNSDSAQPAVVDEFKQTFSISVPVTMYDDKK